jgi:hypothetical protein
VYPHTSFHWYINCDDNLNIMHGGEGFGSDHVRQPGGFENYYYSLNGGWFGDVAVRWDFTAELRHVFFTPRTAFLATLSEATITFKKDISLTQPRMNPKFGSIGTNEFNCLDDSRLFAYGDMDGILRAESARAFEAPLPKGGFLAVFPYLTGAAAFFPLDENMGFKIIPTDDGRIASVRFGVWENTRTGYKKDDKMTVRFLSTVDRIKFADPMPLDDFEWFRRSMGLAGKPAYEARFSQGTVKDTCLVLDIEAKDHGPTASSPRPTSRSSCPSASPA